MKYDKIRRISSHVNTKQSIQFFVVLLDMDAYAQSVRKVNIPANVLITIIKAPMAWRVNNNNESKSFVQD